MKAASDTSAIPDRLGLFLYIVRWVVIIGVLVESRIGFTHARLNRAEIALAAVGMALLTMAASLNWRSFSQISRPAFVLASDLAFVSLIVYSSDGIQSPFYALYYIVVIEAAVAVSTRAALLSATVATAVLLLIEWNEKRGLLTEALIIDDVVRTFPYLFLIAAITGLLMDRVRALAETAAELRVESARSESEMVIARRVQNAQLPTHLPTLHGIEVTTVYEPAREVGGDAYDFYPVEPDRLGIMVADVSGKGVPAALLVASAKYAVREHFSEDLAATISDASAHIASVTGDDTFVTITYGVLATSSMQFRYVNAGGMPPMVVSKGASTAIIHDYADPPVGIDSGREYSVRTVELNAGDTLVLYTDGLTDALSSGATGIDRLAEVLVEINDLPLQQWREELTKHIAEPAHLDDVTVVAIRAD